MPSPTRVLAATSHTDRTATYMRLSDILPPPRRQSTRRTNGAQWKGTATRPTNQTSHRRRVPTAHRRRLRRSASTTTYLRHPCLPWEGKRPDRATLRVSPLAPGRHDTQRIRDFDVGPRHAVGNQPMHSTPGWTAPLDAPGSLPDVGGPLLSTARHNTGRQGTHARTCQTPDLGRYSNNDRLRLLH